jgi:hypothetical protein
MTRMSAGWGRLSGTWRIATVAAVICIALGSMVMLAAPAQGHPVGDAVRMMNIVVLLLAWTTLAVTADKMLRR